MQLHDHHQSVLKCSTIMPLQQLSSNCFWLTKLDGTRLVSKRMGRESKLRHKSLIRCNAQRLLRTYNFAVADSIVPNRLRNMKNTSRFLKSRKTPLLYSPVALSVLKGERLATKNTEPFISGHSGIRIALHSPLKCEIFAFLADS